VHTQARRYSNHHCIMPAHATTAQAHRPWPHPRVPRAQYCSAVQLTRALLKALDAPTAAGCRTPDGAGVGGGSTSVHHRTPAVELCMAATANRGPISPNCPSLQGLQIAYRTLSSFCAQHKGRRCCVHGHGAASMVFLCGSSS